MFVFVTQEETDCIAIGADIQVTVLSIEGDVVHLGIDAPDDRRIFVVDAHPNDSPLVRRLQIPNQRRRTKRLL